MVTPDRRIEQLVNEFVRKVTEFARREGARVLVSPRASTPPVRSGQKTAPRGRRSPRALARLEARVLAYVADHPGARVADINAGLGTVTHEIARSIHALIDAKKLRSAGVTRSTRYYQVTSASVQGVRKVRGAVTPASARRRTRRSPTRSRNTRAPKH